MADSREKFSSLTIAFHWAIGLAIIGVIAAGIYMVDLPEGEWRSSVYGWHKVAGTTVLMLAAARILWRWRNGMPYPASDYPEWQRKLARGTHLTLLFATLALPVSGAIYSWAGTHPVPLLGLFAIQTGTKYPVLYDTFHFIHVWAGWILAGIIALHVAGALKHHFLDHDGTLRRMFGARIG